ncbi:hypothetical protein [Stratiformator vulcanicus]|uniref:Uncharacterized protein n=1 Tax=Stratiformator vulcanicus TaxID=2527980 RepID=A0A517R5T0_9PLAN|nr:hypothetical protein [Stratiformator vulcanicus]QDT39254.1 hypothetical protein Pan189_36580 [Stratiformator vulcanicus]
MSAQFYQVLFDEAGPDGVATINKDDRPASYFPEPGGFQLPPHGEIADWPPLNLYLKTGEFTDYLASTLGCRLCSTKLRDILTFNAASCDVLQWLDVIVTDGDESHPYSILHFPSPPDILDKATSIIVNDFVVKPVLSVQKCKTLNVFTYSGSGQTKLFVSHPVRQEVIRSKCSGIELEMAASR